VDLNGFPASPEPNDDRVVPRFFLECFEDKKLALGFLAGSRGKESVEWELY